MVKNAKTPKMVKLGKDPVKVRACTRLQPQGTSRPLRPWREHPLLLLDKENLKTPKLVKLGKNPVKVLRFVYFVVKQPIENSKIGKVR